MTALKYSQVCSKLLEMKKDPGIIASAKYLGAIRKKALPRQYAASVNALGTFWSNKARQVATPQRRQTSVPSKGLQ